MSVRSPLFDEREAFQLVLHFRLVRKLEGGYFALSKSFSVLTLARISSMEERSILMAGFFAASSIVICEGSGLALAWAGVEPFSEEASIFSASRSLAICSFSICLAPSIV
jgi:hypothetical protein